MRLSLTIPGEHTDVTLKQGLITSRTSSSGHTVMEATLVPGQSSTIMWAVRTAAPPPAPPKELRFLSDVKTLVTVNDGEITLASLIDITVIQATPRGSNWRRRRDMRSPAPMAPRCRKARPARAASSFA